MTERLEPEGAAEAEAPAGPNITVEDFETAARRILPKLVFDYYAGGSGEERTLRENRGAFGRWVIRPRVLVDVAEVDTRTSVLGAEIPFPILLAPTAFQRMAHPDGELATAEGAKELDAVMLVSTISTVSLEDIAATGVRRWFQLYVLKDRDLTAELIKRAHVAGYGAVVLTVDTPILGRRLRDERNSFALPAGITLANLEGSGLPDSTGSGLFSFFLERHDASLTWDDLAWLRSLSPLPMVLKGIVTAEDARLAVEAGVDAIVVSNHGGRQLDGAPATLDALPEVVEAAGGRTEILLDGGVRTGPDVFKSLALGAGAVLIGRPYLWGLAVDGAKGVRTVIEILRDDLVLTMALAGKARVADIDRSAVAPTPVARERGDRT